MPGLKKHKHESRLMGAISTVSDTLIKSLMAKSENDVKNPLTKMKEKCENCRLKFNIQKRS